MRYFAQYDADGKLLAIGTGCGGVEITAEEYGAILVEIRSKAHLVQRMLNGEITVEDIPADWREEIEERVNAMQPTAEERVEELKRKLAKTDYKPLKFVEGELSDTEYFEACRLRSQWRSEINALEAEILAST